MHTKCIRFDPRGAPLSEQSEANSVRSVAGQPDRSPTHDEARRLRAKFPDRSLRKLQDLGAAELAAFLSSDRGGAA